MAINFPLTPSLGQAHTYENKTWEWTSRGWKKKPQSTSVNFYIAEWGYLDPVVFPVESLLIEIEYE